MMSDRRSEAAAMVKLFPHPPPASYYVSRRRTRGVQMLASLDLRRKRVLELGACHGFLGYIAQQELGARVVVTDIFATAFPDFLYGVVADKEDLPFGDSTFDFVMCNDVLHHGDLKKTMQEVNRVLNPGGVFLATEEPCISSREDEKRILQRDCREQLKLGLVERRPNILEYQHAMRYLPDFKILSGLDLRPAVDRNYGGHGIVILGYK